MRYWGILLLIVTLAFTACDFFNSSEDGTDEGVEEVTFQSLTQTGGTSGTSDSTCLTLTFNINPTTLTASNITVLGATKGSLTGTGKQNTLDIVTQFGESEPYESKTDYAAKLCSNLLYGVYEDWFLPSKDELNQIYINLHLHNVGDFTDDELSDYYYSSSEGSSTYAWSIVQSGVVFLLTRMGEPCVRPCFQIGVYFSLNIRSLFEQ